MNGKAIETMAVGRLMKSAAIRFRDKEALYCEPTGRRFTYVQLNERTNRLANALRGVGFTKGNVIAFLSKNRAEVMETFYANAKSGFLGLPLNYRLANKEIIHLLELYEAKALIFENDFIEVAQEARLQLPGIKKYIIIGDEAPDFALEYEALIAESSPMEPEIKVTEDDASYLNLTSGTTGLPKGYILSHYSNANVVIDFNILFNITKDDVVLTVFPMVGRVAFAWGGVSLYVGARQVVMNFEPRKVLEVIQSEKVTISNWVAAMANFILGIEDLHNYDVSSLRGLVFAGSPFPVALQESVRQHICSNLFEYYGLQETAVVCCASPKDKVRKPASIGKITPWSELRIVDDTGADVSTGEKGEIIVKTVSSTTSYYKNENETIKAFRNGWFHTGDLGYLDDEGYIYISGRCKDMIVTGGQNVFAAEVENVLVKHLAVQDCAVIGLPDEKWGEAITAVIGKKPDTAVTEEEIVTFCKGEIAGFKVPKRVIFEHQIPRTPTGKTTKYVLVDKYSKK